MNISDQFTLEKIIVPVIVALITTLGIEYFAKPRLDARKERILRDRKQYDQIIFSFQRLSASIAAIPTNREHLNSKTYTKHTQIMLEEARSASYELFKNLSQLSHTYVINHTEHVSNTSLYIGYIIANIETTIENPNKTNIKELKSLAEHLELFDVYYLVYVYVYDSQVGWWRRLWWRLTERENAFQKVNGALANLKLK